MRVFHDTQPGQVIDEWFGARAQMLGHRGPREFTITLLQRRQHPAMITC